MCLPRHTGEVPPKGAEGEGRSQAVSPFQIMIMIMIMIMIFQKSSVRLSPSGPAGHLPRRTGEANEKAGGRARHFQ
jgi:hypothetical protein